MNKTSIALAVMAGIASVKSWSVAEMSPATYQINSYPVSNGKTGIAAARRSAKKRRRARNG